MDHTLIQECGRLLEEERTRLIEELKAIAVPDPHMKGDWDERFPHFEVLETGTHANLEEEQDEVEEYEVRLEAEHSLESRLLEVNRALERIKTAAFGKCLACGKDIPEERLRANPAAAHDLEHSV